MRNIKGVLAKAAVLGFIVLSAAPVAHATPTVYTILSGQIFTDGAPILTGSYFTFDPVTNQFSTGFDIQTGAGSFPAGGEVYNSSGGCSSVSYIDPPNVPSELKCTSSALGRELSLTYDTLSAAFDLTESPSAGDGLLSPRSARGLRVSSSAPAAVPEPGSVALMVTGLAGIGLWRARRRHDA